MIHSLIVLLSFVLSVACNRQPGETFILPDDPNVVYTGRFDGSDPLRPVFMYSGCAVSTEFTGTSVNLVMKDDSLRNLFTVILDDSLFVLTTGRADNTYALAKNLEDKLHHIEIIRRTEWHGGNTTFLGIRLDKGARTFKPAVKERKIEFIGGSSVCGYGNEGLGQTEDFRYETENNYLTFGAIAARALNAQYVAVCRSGIGVAQGYGGTKEFTMPLHYDEVISGSAVRWNYSKYQPHVVIIALGGNDLSAPLDSVVFVHTYVDFLKRIRSNYSNASIICVAGPSNTGVKWNTWRNLIHATVNEFGKTDKAVCYFEFTPFEAHGSRWHANIAEHKMMADEIIPFIQQLMNW